MRSSLTFSWLVAVAAFACAALAEEPNPFALHDLGHGVYAAIAAPGQGTGGNAGFVVGDDGVAVIDTFQNAEAAEALLAAIRETTPLPVRFVVNTHYHLDHVAGNGVFAAAGATIVAQRNVRAWERVENLKFWDPVPPEKRAWVESFTLPDVLYDRALDLFLGSRRLEVRFAPGHTGSDSVVTVPGANVVFTGDLFWNHSLPNTIDADTAAWIETARRFTAEQPQATFVPGHGEVGSAADVDAFRGYLEALRAAVARGRDRGLTGDALLAAARESLARYATWSWADHFLPANVEEAAAELAGTKRRPSPP